MHECRNWEQGRTVSFLGINKSDFRYSVSGKGKFEASKLMPDRWRLKKNISRERATFLCYRLHWLLPRLLLFSGHRQALPATKRGVARGHARAASIKASPPPPPLLRLMGYLCILRVLVASKELKRP
jgi:hypothetical protein